MFTKSKNYASEFEQILTHILSAEHDVKVPPLVSDESSKARPRQFDGVKIYHLENGLVTVKLGIEVKCWEQKVSVEEVEAFNTKLKDCGFERGIIISSKGFQAGAIESAKKHQIDLITFQKINTDELDEDEISKIKFNLKFKIPRIKNTSISLDPKDFTEEEQKQIKQNSNLLIFRDKPLLLYSAKGVILANLFTFIDNQIKSEKHRRNQVKTINVEEIQGNEIYAILPNLGSQGLEKLKKIQIEYTFSEVNTSKVIVRDE